MTMFSKHQLVPVIINSFLPLLFFAASSASKLRRKPLGMAEAALLKGIGCELHIFCVLLTYLRQLVQHRGLFRGQSSKVGQMLFITLMLNMPPSIKSKP